MTYQASRRSVSSTCCWARRFRWVMDIDVSLSNLLLLLLLPPSWRRVVVPSWLALPCAMVVVAVHVVSSVKEILV
jgi:hypothetical protein